MRQVRYDLMKLPDEYVLEPLSSGDPWAEIDSAVKPMRPLPDPPESVRGSATAQNAEQIGKLQARMAQLEGLHESENIANERDTMRDEKTASDVNAEAIDELRAYVNELDGQVVYLRGLIAALQGTVIEVQQREIERLAKAAASVPE